jgi:hypothetical protein
LGYYKACASVCVWCDIGLIRCCFAASTSGRLRGVAGVVWPQLKGSRDNKQDYSTGGQYGTIAVRGLVTVNRESARVKRVKWAGVRLTTAGLLGGLCEVDICGTGSNTDILQCSGLSQGKRVMHRLIERYADSEHSQRGQALHSFISAPNNQMSQPANHIILHC